MGRLFTACVCACVLAILSTSCSSDHNTRYYASQKYPAKPIESVMVLHSAPTRAYEVIADFQCKGGSEKEMREKAAEIGADAVIVSVVGTGVAVDSGSERPDQKSTYSNYVTLDRNEATLFVNSNTVFASAIRYK